MHDYNYVGYTPRWRCITVLNYVSSFLGSGQTLLCHQATWIGAKLADSIINGISLLVTAAMFFMPAHAQVNIDLDTSLHQRESFIP